MVSLSDATETVRFVSEAAVNINISSKVETKVTSIELSSSIVTSSTAAISFTEFTVSVNVVESL